MSAHRPNKWLSLFAWLLPSGSVKLWALRSLGNHIGRDVFLGPNLVLNCGNFSIADGAAIMNFNIFKQLSSVELGPRSVIGRFNQLTAAPEYQRYSPVVGTLSLGESRIITNHHYVDCSGQVIFRPFSAIGGVKCIIQSHSIDLVDNTSKPGRVVLGRSSGAFTASVLLMDSYLPNGQCWRPVRCSPRRSPGMRCRPAVFTAARQHISFGRSRDSDGGIAPRPIRR